MKMNLINIMWNVFGSIPNKLFCPTSSSKIYENVYVITDIGYTDFYIYYDGKNAISIDAGYINNSYLSRHFEKIGINPDIVSHVFLTHADVDHAGSLDIDSKRGIFKDVKIYMTKEEEDSIKHRMKRKFFLYNPLQIERGYNLISDGDIINVGDIKVQAIKTPGHTMGHTCYIINDKILFTGDALSISRGRIGQGTKLFNQDNAKGLRSIKKLAKLKGIELMCTTHFKHTFEFDKLMESFNILS